MLDPPDPKSRPAKMSEKEDWFLRKTGATLKRGLELSPEEERRTRSKSFTQN